MPKSSKLIGVVTAILLILVCFEFKLETSITRLWKPNPIIKDIILAYHPIKQTIQNMREQLQKLIKTDEENDLDVQLSINMLPNWDYTTLNNLSNFKYNTFNNVCYNSSIFLLAFVISAPQNIERRNAMRLTWAAEKHKKDMRVLFMLGAVKSVTEQEKIEEENRIYGDILQGNFIDSYQNLTYKPIMGLKYAVYYCSKAKYVMKMDDDIIPNIVPLKKYLKEREKLCGRTNYIQCEVRKFTLVQRDSSKWDVTFKEYPNTFYPQYCIGNYPTIYSMDIAFKIYREAQRGDFFWIEDVYLTGFIGNRLNLKYQSFSDYIIPYWDMLVIISTNGAYGKKIFLFGPHSSSSGSIMKYGKYFDKAVHKDIFIGSC